MYAMQTDAITRMRGMLEDEANQKKASMMKEMQAYNKQLALEKKRREQGWKEDQQMQDKAETTLTDHHEKMDPNGKICREDVFWTLSRLKLDYEELGSLYGLFNQVLKQTNNYWSYKCFQLEFK